MTGCAFSIEKEGVDKERGSFYFEESTEETEPPKAITDVAPASELSDGDLPMKSDIPSVDMDTTQQFESNLSTNDISNDINSELKEKVVMTVFADSEGNIDITVTNNFDKDINMGEEFHLQKKAGEKWQDVSLALNYSDNLITISPNESHTFHYYIGNAITLENNTLYQIVKTVSTGQISHPISMSFEIQ